MQVVNPIAARARRVAPCLDAGRYLKGSGPASGFPAAWVNPKDGFGTGCTEFEPESRADSGAAAP